jgi:hypothetical protein
MFRMGIISFATVSALVSLEKTYKFGKKQKAEY